jgi:D-alanine-D-alanine ligase
MRKPCIALIFGGDSEESEISRMSSRTVFKALRGGGKYKIKKYDLTKNLKKFILDAIDNEFDLVLPILHGKNGEDGRLQGMLDFLGIPYVFSGCLASALAMDKQFAKLIAKSAGLTIAKDIVLSKNEKINIIQIQKKLSLPIVIKPVATGSSIGMTIAKNTEELRRGVKLAFRHGDKIIMEEFIRGREFTVAVISAKDKIKALPVIEIIPKISDWFDYGAKYKKGASEEMCPAIIPPNIAKQMQKQAIKIHRALGCKDLTRSDFIWNGKNNKLYFLELNTIPGLTDLSLVPKAVKASAINFGDFLSKIIDNNLTKNV